MHLVELNKLIEGGESSTVEFKRKFSSPEKIAKEMIAFANSKGGYILFGVDDDRKIVGVESEKGELELISAAAKFFCEPEIEFSSEIIMIKRPGNRKSHFGENISKKRKCLQPSCHVLK